MAHVSYVTEGVCARKIEIEIDENDRVTSVRFLGGCAGNTQGVAALAVGLTVDEILQRLSGIRCGFKPTSCPDQLAKALMAAKAQLEENN